MGREVGPPPEVARLRTTPGPPSLQKLSISASSGASPGTSPRSAGRQPMSRSRSSGGGLSPSAEMQQAATGADAWASDAAAGPAEQQGQQQPAGSSSASPELPRTLEALHALSHPAANGAAAPAAAAEQPGGKHHKRGSFLGLFHRAPKNGGRYDAVDAASDEPGSSSAGELKLRNRGGGWFGFGGGKKDSASASPLASPDASLLPAAAGSPVSNGVLLPGLPLAEEPGRPGSRAGSSTGSSAHAGDAAAPAGGVAGMAGGQRLGEAGAAAGYAADVSASEASAPSSAQPSPAMLPALALPPGTDPGTAQRKSSHRRHRSITSLLLKPGWRRRGHHSAGSESELGGDVTPPRGGSYGPSRAGSPAPEAAKALAAAAGGYGACFGLASGAPTDAEEEVVAVPPAIPEEELPPPPLLPQGTTGLKNIGNTCFFNAALQCLRYTPGLPLQVVPDLLQLAEQRQQQRTGAAAVPAAPGPAAAGEGQQAEQQQQQQQPERQPSVDVHEQALARASCEVPPEAVEAARRQLEAVSSGACCEAAAAAAAAADQVPAAPEAAAPGSVASPAAAGAEQDARQQQERQEQEQAQGAVASVAPAAVALAQAAAQQAQPAKPQRPPRGALLEAFATLVKDLYLQPANGEASACAAPLLRTLRAFPIAADYFDGGQHDCQEVLRVVLDLLHEDLNRVPPKQQAQQEAQQAQQDSKGSQEAEAPPADAANPSAAAPQQGAGGAAHAATQGAAAQQQPDGQQPGEQIEGEQQQAGQQRRADGPSLQEGQQQAPQQQTGGEEQGGAQREQEGGGQQQQAQQQQSQQAQQEDEAAKAERLWQQYLERDDSPISDLFGGQLQSSVTCHKCGGRFTMYEPFWDLSLPLSREGRGGFSWLGLKGTPATIQDCLTAFTADEKLEGEEAFHCEVCKEKTAATKHLRVHRFPEVLVLHIKRFKYKGASTDKLTASVTFPLRDLALHQFASPECPALPGELRYELFAVSNHYGNLSGGHYTAMCRVPQPDGDEQWYSFNDENVVRVSPSQVVSQFAYILFYVRSRKSSAAAAAAGRSHHHRRTSSAASAGAAAAVAAAPGS